MANSGAFVKGQKKPNQGKRGPAKVTSEFKQTVQKLLEDNADNVALWLKQVAEGNGTDRGQPDPGKALDMLTKLAEYAAPKLARTVHVGDPDAPQHHTFTWQK
jgi:hypothetical protein